MKTTPKKDTRNVTLRLREETMKKIDAIAEEHQISRQKLIEAILQQVIEEKNFVLKIG